MKRRFRLAKQTDFKRVRRHGKSYAHPLIVLVALPNEGGIPRFGVSAGRSVGGAVQRNRAKRRIREVLRPLVPEIRPGWDLVFLARRSIGQAAFPELENAIRTVLRRAKLLELDNAT
ncbi:MAG: ribonuclease P protein component [Anaerolineales bacterium]